MRVPQEIEQPERAVTHEPQIPLVDEQVRVAINWPANAMGAARVVRVLREPMTAQTPVAITGLPILVDRHRNPIMILHKQIIHISADKCRPS